MQQWHGDWAEGNGFAGHLAWHQALFALERLDTAEALRLFDAHLQADPAQLTLQRLDAAALLWRLHLLDAEVGTRWTLLAAGWDLSDEAAGRYPFNDLHALLALIGSADLDGARRWSMRAAANAQRSGGTNQAVARDI